MNNAVLNLKDVLRIGIQSFRLQKGVEVVQIPAIEQNNRSLVRRDRDLLRHRGPRSCAGVNQQSDSAHRSSTHAPSEKKHGPSQKSPARRLTRWLKKILGHISSALFLRPFSSYPDPSGH